MPWPGMFTRARHTAVAEGGGIQVDTSSTLTMNDSSSITGNTADVVDQGGVTGGGIYIFPCGGGIVVGAVDGGNVNDNYRGTAVPVEDNISAPACG